MLGAQRDRGDLPRTSRIADRIRNSEFVANLKLWIN